LAAARCGEIIPDWTGSGRNGCFSSQDVANYRAAAIARLKAEYAENDTKIAELQARNAEIRAKQARLELPIPKDACPVCFYDYGVIAALRTIPADPDNPGVDRFACENGHDF
jgi:hypothetical protein